jgi:hypothetical protein
MHLHSGYPPAMRLSGMDVAEDEAPVSKGQSSSPGPRAHSLSSDLRNASTSVDNGSEDKRPGRRSWEGSFTDRRPPEGGTERTWRPGGMESLFVVLGLPGALVLAWALEITPEGIRATPDLTPEELASIRSGGHGERPWVHAAVGLVVVAGAAATTILLRRPESAPELDRTRVAVAVFRNGTGADEERVRDPLSAFADETGAAMIVSGAYYRNSEDLRFRAEALAVSEWLASLEGPAPAGHGPHPGQAARAVPRA